MNSSKWMKLDDLRQPGMRRVLEGLLRVRNELQEQKEDKINIPPAHVIHNANKRGHAGHGR